MTTAIKSVKRGRPTPWKRFGGPIVGAPRTLPPSRRRAKSSCDDDRHELPTAIRGRLLAFMDEHIYPNEARYREELNALPNRFSTVPLMDELKTKARAAHLWNLWLPAAHGGQTNVEYAPQAEIMGRVLWSPEAFNCNARIPATWRCSSSTGMRHRRRCGSSRCSRARSARATA